MCTFLSTFVARVHASVRLIAGYKKKNREKSRGWWTAGEQLITALHPRLGTAGLLHALDPTGRQVVGRHVFHLRANKRLGWDLPGDLRTINGQNQLHLRLGPIQFELARQLPSARNELAALDVGTAN